MVESFYLIDSDATQNAGAELLKKLPQKAVIFLRGDLGAGKTTFVRGLLRTAGVSGAIKSPTYALVEEYETPERKIFHFDLYRLADPDELEWIGIDDYLNQNALCFIEWAEKGAGILPPADIEIFIFQQDDGRFLKIDDKNNIITL
jgi:tRNA threonylcarbamoyladenosine biosynthesis protein TsaE